MADSMTSAVDTAESVVLQGLLWHHGYGGLVSVEDRQTHRRSVIRSAPPLMAAAIDRQLQRRGNDGLSVGSDAALDAAASTLAGPREQSGRAVTRALRDLSAAEADGLMQMIVEALDSPTVISRGVLGRSLARLVCTGVERATPYLRRVYDSRIIVPHVAWIDADDDMRETLIEDGAYGPLEWIADERVCEALANGEIGTLATLPLVAEMGHLFHVNGALELLYLEPCFELVPAEEAASDVHAPVMSMCRADDGTLDLLRVDLTDSIAEPIGMVGDRLRIPFRLAYEPCFWSVSGDGTARPYGASPEGEAVTPDRVLVPGDECASPFEGADGLYLLASRFGGTPSWTQDPAFQECPECGAWMACLAQIELCNALPVEGTAYAMLCADCEIAATVVQVG